LTHRVIHLTMSNPMRAFPPTGTVDRLFDAAQQVREVEDNLLATLHREGFREVMLPLLEREEVFASQGAVRFVDRHGDVLGLRADFTGPAARVVATRLSAMPEVRLCYRGAVFRDTEAGSHARRQQQQAGFEIYDSGRIDSDLQALRTSLRVCEALGLRATASLGSARQPRTAAPAAAAAGADRQARGAGPRPPATGCRRRALARSAGAAARGTGR
jgi:ATP phosphoribosyltransferase regulatory subunit HisZ